MSQMRPKQIKLNNQGDLLVGGENGTGTILPIGQQENTVPLVKNIGTKSSPVYGHVFEQLTGTTVLFDDSVANIGASNVQDAITKLNKNLTGSIVYTGTVDASAGIFTPTLPNKIVKGTYYLVTNAGNSIQTNSGGSPNQNLLSGDAIIWNGSYWDTMAHIDTGVQGTSGQVDVSGTQDTGYTLNIDSSYIGQSSIGTVGTITTGTWQGSSIDLAHGGTGSNLANIADNTILYKEGSGVSSTGPSLSSWIASASVSNKNQYHQLPVPNFVPSEKPMTGTYSSNNFSGLTYTVNISETSGVVLGSFFFHNPDYSAKYYNNFPPAIYQSTFFPQFQFTLVVNPNNNYVSIVSGTAPTYPGTPTQYMSDTWVLMTPGLNPKPGLTLTPNNDFTSVNPITVISVTANLPPNFNGFDSYGNAISNGQVLDSITFNNDTSPSVIIKAYQQSVTSGQSFVSYNSSTNNFEWHSADDIVTIAKHPVMITDEFPIVSGSGGNGQIGAASNVSLTLTQTPIANTLNVFLNGDRLDKNDYSISGNTITLNDTVNGYTVEATDVVSITYEYQAGN